MLSFKDCITPYATDLGLTPAQVTAQAADADSYANTLATQSVLHHADSQWTTWKRLLRHGGSPSATVVPSAPVLPAAIPSVTPGIESRFRALVQLIKASPAYNVAIGQALGIEGTEKGGPDLSAIAPTLTATLTGTHVQIGWGWQGHGEVLSMIEIHVNRGNGYTLLTYDTTPGYTDTAPIPATPTKWTYKAIYRIGDHEVGQWSLEVSITVGG